MLLLLQLTLISFFGIKHKEIFLELLQFFSQMFGLKDGLDCSPSVYAPNFLILILHLLL